jgi:hypothetical protein
VLHCRSTEPLHSRSVHGDELTNFPIIYPDLRLDYKVATHPTFWRVRPKMGEKYGRSGDGDHHVVERILRCCGKVRIFVGTDYARKNSSQLFCAYPEIGFVENGSEAYLRHAFQDSCGLSPFAKPFSEHGRQVS